MTALDALPPLREVIARHGLSARKDLGQNFILDLNLTRRIARAAGPLENHTIIEIGPGPGGLTRALLLEGAKKIIAIERDSRVLPALEEISRAAPGRLQILEADALETELESLADGPVRIVANLPYNIATPLLTGWLTPEKWPPFYDSLTLMFQLEVAQRICASAGGKNYGRLSVLANWRSRPELAFQVARSAFTPPPKVTSAIVHMIPDPEATQVLSRSLEDVTRAAFGQRRKMIRQSLKQLGRPLQYLLEGTGLTGEERAEDLPVETFLKIASQYQNAVA